VADVRDDDVLRPELGGIEGDQARSASDLEDPLAAEELRMRPHEGEHRGLGLRRPEDAALDEDRLAEDGGFIPLARAVPARGGTPAAREQEAGDGPDDRRCAPLHAPSLPNGGRAIRSW
jgi:hypothetical protein